MKITFKLILAAVLGSILLVAVIVNSMEPPPTRPLLTTTPAAAPAGPQLALLSSRGGESSSAYYKVEGEVQNIGTEPLRAVVAVATWYDKNDAFISSESGMVEFDPLMPGQKSPYKVLIRSNPLMHQYGVTFKSIRGGELRVEDRRKSSKKK